MHANYVKEYIIKGSDGKQKENSLTTVRFVDDETILFPVLCLFGIQLQSTPPQQL